MADTTAPATPADVTTTPTPGTAAGAPTPDATPPAGDAAPKTEVAKALAAIAKREREARRIQDEAEKIRGKWGPLEEAAAKGDLQALIRAAGQIAGHAPESVMDAIVSAIAEEGREKTPQEFVAAQVAEALAAEKKRAEEESAKQRDATLAETRTKYLTHVEQTAQAHPDAYPLIADEGADAAAEVLTLVEQWHKESGEFLGTERAMKLIEEKLQEKARARAARLGLAPAASPPANGSAAPQLTNKHTGGVPGVVDTGDPSTLSDSQRLRRAMARVGVRA